MDMTWPLQDAKNRLSELLETVLKNGAQTIRPLPGMASPSRWWFRQRPHGPWQAPPGNRELVSANRARQVFDALLKLPRKQQAKVVEIAEGLLALHAALEGRHKPQQSLSDRKAAKGDRVVNCQLCEFGSLLVLAARVAAWMSAACSRAETITMRRAPAARTCGRLPG